MPKSLGLVPIPPDTFEHDMAVIARFQEFSAELLRLSLLGITALGAGALKYAFRTAQPEVGERVEAAVHGATPSLAGALVLFTVAAAAALTHRYVSSDSLSWHLQAMRRYERGEPSDVECADRERQQRYRRFRQSAWALRASSGSLAAAAALFAYGIFKLLA